MVGSIVPNEAILSGKICSNGNLTGSIVSSMHLIGTMSIPVGHVKYTGNYNITPQTIEQVMATKDKYMDENVTVNPIPYYEVSNMHGGVTIIIGG